RYFPKITLLKEKTLLIDGPASVVLQHGTASILGARIRGGITLPIPKHRRIPIETSGEAIFQVWLGENGSFRQVKGSTIPTSWQEAAGTISRPKGLAVVLGDVDSGKSTLCTYLANSCLDRKIQPSIIDGDVGQADIGPPATTSSSTVSKHIFSLHELTPERSYFIGDTSPSLVPDKHVQSIVRLDQDISKKNGITIVNTDGWLREDAAIEHKLTLLEKLRPSLVLGLGPNNELDHIIDAQQYPNLKLDASNYALTRTREQRKGAREEGYRKFLRNARNLDVKLSAIKLRMFKDPSQERIDQTNSHKGLLAGLLDEEGALLSIGRIIHIANGTIRVTTTIDETPKIVELGAVILSSTFSEVGFES
ncbi:MAG TPA: Clp1/GlmU family protein, partial [Candidatus Bathyarchaeia archaeon]|nr:Clp1/GlmU family protein [Candidatus Bathyarchaeia archaeon]